MTVSLSLPLSLSVSICLFRFYPTRVEGNNITKKNVLLDVFLCIKVFKIGKACWGPLVISHLYSYIYLWKKKTIPLNKINTSFNFCFSLFSDYQRHAFINKTNKNF